jgi:hypothetical protein
VPCGRTATVTGITIQRSGAEDRIVEGWTNWDMLDDSSQLRQGASGVGDAAEHDACDDRVGAAVLERERLGDAVDHVCANGRRRRPLGQLDQCLAPVIRMRSACDEARRLERVEQAGDVRRAAGERPSELTLGHRALVVQSPDHLAASAREPELGKPGAHRVTEQRREREQASQTLARGV